MYDFLDTSTPNSGLGTPLRSGGEIINANFRRLHSWVESRANVATSTIPTLAAGGPAYLLTTEFSSGNPMPLTSFKRRGTAPSDVTNPAYVQSADLQWWEMCISGGEVFIEQFGGKNDSAYNGLGGTDNYTPTLKAFDFGRDVVTATEQWALKLRFGIGNYRFSAGFTEIHVRIHIQGANGIGTGACATRLHFPATVDPFIFQGNNTTGRTGTGSALGSSDGSCLEKLGIYCGGGVSNSIFDENRVGILARTKVHLRDLDLFNLPGKGIWIRATAGAGGWLEGNCNEWKITDVRVHAANGDYLHIQGNDTQGGRCIGFVTHDSVGKNTVLGTLGGAGIKDESGLGCNSFITPQITGYSPSGVWHDGKIYQLISITGSMSAGSADIILPGIGSTTTPGTNNAIWYYLGDQVSASASFPAWVSGQTYTIPGPFWSAGMNSVAIATYCETGMMRAHLPGAFIAIGGNLNTTSSSGLLSRRGTGDARVFSATQGFGTFRDHMLAAEVAVQGNASYAFFGEEHPGGLAAGGGIGFVQHGRAIDRSGAIFNWGYAGLNITYGSENAKPYWFQTTPTSTETFGRNAAVPDMVGFYDIALVDINSSTNKRIIGLAQDPPTGYHAEGETFITNAPSFYGYSAVTNLAAGNPATWGTIPVFGLTSATPRLNGHLVVECTSNTQMKFKYKGSDGVVRSASLTLS